MTFTVGEFKRFGFKGLASRAVSSRLRGSLFEVTRLVVWVAFFVEEGCYSGYSTPHASMNAKPKTPGTTHNNHIPGVPGRVDDNVTEVSKKRGALSIPQYSIVLMIGTPKQGLSCFWNSPQ